jgi:hypothetical protein
VNEAPSNEVTLKECPQNKSPHSYQMLARPLQRINRSNKPAQHWMRDCHWLRLGVVVSTNPTNVASDAFKKVAWSHSDAQRVSSAGGEAVRCSDRLCRASVLEATAKAAARCRRS